MIPQLLIPRLHYEPKNSTYPSEYRYSVDRKSNFLLLNVPCDAYINIKISLQKEICFAVLAFISIQYFILSIYTHYIQHIAKKRKQKNIYLGTSYNI